MSLMRWSPFEEMDILRNQINSVFDSQTEYRSKHSLPLEILETENGYLVSITVPGINPEQIQLESSKNELTVSAVKSPREMGQNEKLLLNEFPYGKFSRKVAFPFPIDTEKIEANYEFGILKVSVPKLETALPRRIEIKTENH